MRYRGALFAVVGLVAMAAAGASLGVAECGPTHNAKAVSSAAPSATTPATTPSPTTTTTTMSTPASKAPAGFSPVSVTFVSAESGWVLGTVPAGSGAELAIAHTTDGGITWSKSPAPDVTFDGAAAGSAIIAFADPTNGWITAPLTNTDLGPLPSTLWSTHDGGVSWQQVAVPHGGHVTALDASGGVFQLAELAPNGSDGTVVYLYSSAATSDTWARSATSLPIGAGPVASAQLTLQGGEGWAIETDRTVGDGARLTSGTWGPWTPPCTYADGSASLAASSTTDLVALCHEGVWGPPPAGTTTGPWLFASSDGGSDFVAAGAVPTTAAASGPIPSLRHPATRR